MGGQEGQLPGSLDFPHARGRALGLNIWGAGMKYCIICPYYGKNDDYCDVGCGYISPHDVNMIIKFCNGNFADCMKYRELSDRFPQQELQLAFCQQRRNP